MGYHRDASGISLGLSFEQPRLVDDEFGYLY